jgi:hypothetical protein
VRSLSAFAAALTSGGSLGENYIHLVSNNELKREPKKDVSEWQNEMLIYFAYIMPPPSTCPLDGLFEHEPPALVVAPQ